jgi:hypothetical protein
MRTMLASTMIVRLRAEILGRVFFPRFLPYGYNLANGTSHGSVDAPVNKNASPSLSRRGEACHLRPGSALSFHDLFQARILPQGRECLVCIDLGEI